MLTAVVLASASTKIAVNTWETLTFDFGSPVNGGFDPANTYNRLSIFFNIGAEGSVVGEQTYFFDDIALAPPPAMFETITFDDSGTTYTLADFGGNASSIVNDPTGGTNQVVQAIRTGGAQTFAGTTVSTLPNNEILQPISAGNLVMSARVYSPVSGVPVRLKVEDSGNNAIFVEADATTTAVNTWETLVFDFGSPVNGGFDPANTYNRLSIFFNIGAEGSVVGEQTYFFDDVALGSGGGGIGGGSGSELAVNGDFEAGDLSGWTNFDNGGSITLSSAESSGGGAFSVNVIANPGQNPVIKQEFRAAGTVVPGQTVNISFDMKGTIATDFGGVVIPELFSEGASVGTDTLDTITMGTTDWTTYSYTSTAGADVSNGITLQIAVICGGDPQCQANVFIDNVSLTLDSGT